MSFPTFKDVGGENVIYVISDPEQVRLLPDGAVRISFSYFNTTEEADAFCDILDFIS